MCLLETFSINLAAVSIVEFLRGSDKKSFSMNVKLTELKSLLALTQ